jgi:uncharacterized protein YpbB
MTNDQFLEGLFLFAAARFRGERTPQAIVHLLRGRKNNQVIADAALFGTSMLYGVMHTYTNKEVREKLDALIERRWIEVRQAEKAGVACSAIGLETLRELESQFHYSICTNAIASVHEKVRAVRFWKKVSLFVQTLSHLVEGETLFYPVIEQRQLQQEVKQVLASYPDKREAARQTKEELARWMEVLQEEERQLLLLRLSGKARVGLTYRQLADELGMVEEAAALHVIRLAAEQVKRLSNSTFPVLARLAYSGNGDVTLTQSAQQTKGMLALGLSFDEIVRRRRLKPGTIEDHIVEIAIADPAFDIGRFVPEEKMRRIHQVIREKGMKKIGDIRREVGEGYSYLEIRLASVRVPKGGE